VGTGMYFVLAFKKIDKKKSLNELDSMNSLQLEQNLIREG
jgi:hypothetical protein